MQTREQEELNHQLFWPFETSFQQCRPTQPNTYSTCLASNWISSWFLNLQPLAEISESSLETKESSNSLSGVLLTASISTFFILNFFKERGECDVGYNHIWLWEEGGVWRALDSYSMFQNLHLTQRSGITMETAHTVREQTKRATSSSSSLTRL